MKCNLVYELRAKKVSPLPAATGVCTMWQAVWQRQGGKMRSDRDRDRDLRAAK